MQTFLDQLFRWPFNAGETIALLVLSVGLIAVNFAPEKKR